MVIIVAVLYTTLALTRVPIPATTTNSNKKRALQRVQLTIFVNLSDLRTFRFPVSGFCYLEDICIMRETKELGGQKR